MISPVAGSTLTPSGTSVASGSNWNALSFASGTSVFATESPSFVVNVGVTDASSPTFAVVSAYAGS